MKVPLCNRRGYSLTEMLVS